MISKENFLKAITVLEVVYDNFRILNDDKALAVWYEFFKDDDEQTFIDSVKTYCSTNEFKPTPAGIRKCMVKLKNIGDRTPEEAWSELQRCIKRYGYYRVDEAYEYLEKDETLHRIAKAMNLQDLCLSENVMADRAHFLKIYDVMLKRKEEKVMIPNRIKDKYELEDNPVKLLSEKMDMNKLDCLKKSN